MCIDLIGLVVMILVVIGNIIAWVYSYGKLSERVKNLDDTINNGICEKVDGISRHVSTMEGTLVTYIQLKEKVGKRSKTGG